MNPAGCQGNKKEHEENLNHIHPCGLIFVVSRKGGLRCGVGKLAVNPEAWIDGKIGEDLRQVLQTTGGLSARLGLTLERRRTGPCGPGVAGDQPLPVAMAMTGLRFGEALGLPPGPSGCQQPSLPLHLNHSERPVRAAQERQPAGGLGRHPRNQAAKLCPEAVGAGLAHWWAGRLSLPGDDPAHGAAGHGAGLHCGQVAPEDTT
jgi:hypothetical protein